LTLLRITEHPAGVAATAHVFIDWRPGTAAWEIIASSANRLDIYAFCGAYSFTCPASYTFPNFNNRKCVKKIILSDKADCTVGT